MLNELSKEVHEIAVKKGWWDDPQPTFGEIIALCHAELSEALEEHRAGHPMEWRQCLVCYEEDAVAGIVTLCGEASTEPCDCLDDPKCFYRGKKPEGVAVELADCILRILDYCGHEGIDIDRVIRDKIEYNKTRTYRHGGKRL